MQFSVASRLLQCRSQKIHHLKYCDGAVPKVCVFIGFQLMKTWPEADGFELGKVAEGSATGLFFFNENKICQVDPDDPNQFMSDSSEPEEDPTALALLCVPRL